MIFSGFKHECDNPGYNEGVTLPDWCQHLEWSKPNGQVIPAPYTEITRDKWLVLNQCSHESEVATFYSGMNIPGEFEWFGGWRCNIAIYYTYGTICAQMNFSPSSPPHVRRPILGIGTVIHQDSYTSYVLRFFKFGCEHRWIAVPEESRMCYHVSVCTKCGQQQTIDSSD